MFKGTGRLPETKFFIDIEHFVETVMLAVYHFIFLALGRTSKNSKMAPKTPYHQAFEKMLSSS